MSDSKWRGGLPEFRRKIGDPAFIAGLVARPGLGDAVEARVRESLNELDESLVALEAAGGPRGRVLEIGAGLGLFGAYLKSHGVDYTGIEPSDAAFGRHAPLLQAIIDALGVDAPTILPIGASALDPATHGRFDVIFSSNVMEHVLDLPQAMQALAAVLAPGGVMAHICPNYAMPYEPHFGLPLVPLRPRATARIMRRLASHPVWHSLNFVTAARIARLARDNGLTITFLPGQMHRAFARLFSDPVFATRQAHLMRVGAWMRRLGLLQLLRVMPARLGTPMLFVCRHA